MAEITVVHLVRHGEVDNPDGVLYGRLPDFHLSEEGMLMAKAAAAYLAGRDVSLLLSSPLERALETAAPIAAQFGLEVRVDERLIEPWNRFEGSQFDVIQAARQPGAWPALANPFRPSWGEPYADTARRTGGRRCASATSSPYGSPAGRPRNAGCGTIPQTGSALSAA